MQFKELQKAMRYVRGLGARKEIAGVELVVAVISLDFDITSFSGAGPGH